jgi:hypothetical protein
MNELVLEGLRYTECRARLIIGRHMCLYMTVLGFLTTLV